MVLILFVCWSVGQKNVNTVKKKDVLFSEMTIISCKLRNTKEGCLHMAQNQLYPELIIDFSRSCFTFMTVIEWEESISIWVTI